MEGHRNTGTASDMVDFGHVVLLKVTRRSRGEKKEIDILKGKIRKKEKPHFF